MAGALCANESSLSKLDDQITAQCLSLPAFTHPVVCPCVSRASASSDGEVLPKFEAELNAVKILPGLDYQAHPITQEGLSTSGAASLRIGAIASIGRRLVTGGSA